VGEIPILEINSCPQKIFCPQIF